MRDYKGVIIQESLADVSMLKGVRILSTEIEKVTPEHKTHAAQWTLHTIEVPEDEAAEFALKISKALDREHSWYADFKNETHHYIIFKDKVFFIDRTNKEQY